LSGPDQYHRLIALLGARGYSEARIEKILGLNFVNFAREVWGA
jgi:membrane dipeptidase